MPIKVTCMKCGGVLHAPDDSGGKRGRCPTCGTVLMIPAGGAEDPSPSAGGSRLRGGGPPAASENPFAAPNPFGASAPAETYPIKPPSPGKQSSNAGTMAYPLAEPTRGKSGAFKGLPPRPDGGGRMSSMAGGRPTVPPPVPAETVPEDAGDWRRFAKGLGRIRTGIVFLALAVIAPAGVVLYEQFAGPLPDKNPGYLGLQNLPAAEEIRVGAAAVPGLLGLLLVMLGKLSAARPPAASFARGLAAVAFLGTLVALAAVVAAAVPVVTQVANAGRPDDIAGTVLPWQRLALKSGVILGLAAELWFAVVLGRVGVVLGNSTVAARAGRVVFVLSALGLAAAVAAVGFAEFPTDVNNWLAANVQPKWDELGAKQPAVVAGTAIAVTVIVAVVYVRLVGSARRAVREANGAAG
jgi:ribosomal protein S27E